MDVEILQDLGLTNAEIKVYVSLLELGSSTAGRILERSGLQNSVVHRAINSLIEKGIISFILEGKRKIYRAADPNNFYNFIEDKKKRFEQILPELKEKQIKAKQENEAEIYKGKRGVKEIYQRLIDSGGTEYNTYGGGKRVTYDVMGETWWENFHIKRIQKKIKSRQIFDETLRKFGEKLNKKAYTNIKFLPSEFEQLTETIIIGDYVAIVLFTESPYGLLIRDKIVAESYRKNFNLLWRLARK